jgi:adenosine deaminase
MQELVRAKENGLKIAVHMGESTEELDQMLIIDKLEPDLIDHGVNLCKEAENWVRKQNIPVTICLTSSIATKMHNPKNIHPWITNYLESEGNHSIDLGTDDSTVFGNIFLSDEFFKLVPVLEFEKIVQIANESFERSKKIFGIKTT